MIDPEKFQGLVMGWTMHNFPRSQRHQPLLGLVEEIGELAEAFTKVEEEPELSQEEHWPKVMDAAGDTMIFMAHFCGLNGFSLVQCAEKQADNPLKKSRDLLRELQKSVGRLAHSFLKNEQGVRNSENHGQLMMLHIGLIVQLLSELCGEQGEGLMKATDLAWNEVKDRDWIKWPKTGRDPDPFIDPAPIDEVRQWTHPQPPAAKLAKKLEQMMPPIEKLMPPKKSSWSIPAHYPARITKPKNPCGSKAYSIPKNRWGEEVPF